MLSIGAFGRRVLGFKYRLLSVHLCLLISVPSNASINILKKMGEPGISIENTI